MSKANKRGGQPGNQNAFKQGFYSRQIPNIEWDLSGTRYESLEGEITAIQVLISRLAEAMEKPDPQLKDPHAPYKMLLLATRRLNVIRTIQAELQD